MIEGVVKVTKNYQVTIPSHVRKKFYIREGDLVKVVFDEKENVVKIVPMESEMTQ